MFIDENPPIKQHYEISFSPKVCYKTKMIDPVHKTGQ